MKTDTYTKIILTVIAVCLLCLVSKTPVSGSFVSNANAQDSSHPLVETRHVVDVNIVSIDGKTFGLSQVSLSGPALPVYIINK